MNTKVLRGNTCGWLHLPPELPCNKYKPSIEKNRLTGKRSKRKIKICEKLRDTIWASNRFDYKRAKHKDVVHYLNKVTVTDTVEDYNDLTNTVNSNEPSEILNKFEHEIIGPNQSTSPPQPSEILNNTTNVATVNVLDVGGG